MDPGQHTVTSVVVVADDHVAGLFPAQAVAVGPHFFRYVAVTDLGADILDTPALKSLGEAQIAHDGRHDRVLLQAAMVSQVRANHVHDVVAVDFIAVFVNRDAAVGIPVKGQAQLGTLLDNFFLQAGSVGGPAVVVNVEPVWVG